MSDLSRNHQNAQANIDQIVDQLGTNNHSKGFTETDRWAVETHIRVTQIQAILAVAEALRSN